ncbi:MFS transporter [Rhodobium gokarnense]|uniref:MFS family permease n=1 Tax=Rhodobium gokarnense TaxID=364296 RepID=A0ABT3HCD2_9HYPH|nr:MFS transporter [Rhodobium gokarnense]MCW2308058.1 MFS family permease [Rhodobium gokarnense]
MSGSLPSLRRAAAFVLVASGTVIGLAGTDLVLPAVPSLPAALGGTLERAQLVLAAFTGGTVVGLLMFGELGNRFDQRKLLAGSLLVYALVSALAAMAPSLDALIGLRAVQGASATAAAVFAPGILRALYGDEDAVGALGRISSIEVLAPALGPIAGLWLLNAFGWRASFHLLAALAFSLGLLVLFWRRLLPDAPRRNGTGGYRHLLSNWTFVRSAIEHAATVGGLLLFVFGAPTVFVVDLGATVTDFIIMQAIGITVFIVLANVSGRLVKRFTVEWVVRAGALIFAVGAVAMLVYAVAGGADTAIVTAIFLLVNGGLGIRGPAGFHQAIVAAEDDARGSAFVIMAMLGVAAVGTALVAPFITDGLVPLAAVTAMLAVTALLLRFSASPARA